MKKLIAIVLCLVTMLSMVACGQTENSAEATTKPIEVGVFQETPKVENTKEPAEVTKLTEASTKTTADEASTNTPAEVASKASVEATTKAPAEAATKVPAEAASKAPAEAASKTSTKESVKAPAKESAEVPEKSAECAHRWESAGERDEGMILYECKDCSAMKLEYKCTHEYCIPENLTDSDGTSYIRYTCYGCGYTYTSSVASGQDDNVADSNAPIETPTEEPTEVPKESSECTTHRWDYSGEPETGAVVRKCLDCSAMYVEYKCAHDLCFKEYLTDSDGTDYIRYTCYGCNAVFTSRD